MGLGALNANPTNINLLLDGISGGSIVMPTETVWMVKVYISILEYDYNVTDFIGRVASLEYSSMLWKDKTTQFSSTPILVNQFYSGFGASLFDLYMPVVSNKIAPYITCKLTGKTAVVSATIQYTQSKFQRTPII
jgi:hypothetical protein